MSDQLWDAIVVGAGVIGCSAAHHLSKEGSKTLLLEQFPLPHTRGSSSGQSRLIRSIYNADCYTVMMPESFRQWHQLEEESGKTLFKQTGMLLVEGGQLKTIQKYKEVMTKHKVPFESLNPVQLQEHYPFFQYPDDHNAILDRSAGILIPNKCLAALQESFLKNGGKIIDRCCVVNITPGDIVTLATNRGEIYRTKQLVLCAGGWSLDLFTKIGLHHVPLKTMPGLHAFWKLRDPTKYNGGQDFPIIVNQMTTSEGYWFIACFPSYEYPGMLKVAMRREPSHRYCHPDRRDSGDDDDMVSELYKYIARHIPCVETSLSIKEPCLYTMTPDQHFILDRHPDHRNILLAVGAGHAFKSAPVLGKILCELVHNKKLSYDISQFSVKRFQKPLSSNL